MSDIKMQTAPSVVKASEVIGTDVVDAEGKNLGEINEIILDKLSGHTRYVVLSFGGFMGLGDKLFALPWKAISYDPDKESFILDIDKEVLKNAPGFNKNNWPNMADREWQDAIEQHYRIYPKSADE